MNESRYNGGSQADYGGIILPVSGYKKIWKLVQITVGDIVEVGTGLACARDVVIRSYDGHIITHCEGKALPNQASSRPIRIGKHVWIGQNAMLLKGITIGDGAVVAAGAIVTKDVPPRVAVAGVPAQVKKQNIEWT